MLEPPPKPKAPIGSILLRRSPRQSQCRSQGFRLLSMEKRRLLRAFLRSAQRPGWPPLPIYGARVLACVKCQHLAASRKNVVFGVGNISAELMFVGEAPGRTRIFKAKPSWKSGQLLTKIIETNGIDT